MDIIENNKTLIVQIVAGAVLAIVLNWLSIPVWLIGAGVAAVVSLWTSKMVEVYDRQIAPHIKDLRTKGDD